MSRRFQPGRQGSDEQVWLSALIDAMEQAAQPERIGDGEPRTLAVLRAQLALPARSHFTSAFSLRH